jgi:hypothetical protein
MDNSSLMTGNQKLDWFLLGIGWIFAAITPASIPIILSSIASALVIINQGSVAYKKNSSKFRLLLSRIGRIFHRKKTKK